MQLIGNVFLIKVKQALIYNHEDASEYTSATEGLTKFYLKIPSLSREAVGMTCKLI